MDQGVEAAAVDRNFVAAFRELSAGVEGGTVRTIGRVHVSATRFPIAFFNAAFVTEPLAPGAADVAEAVSMLRDLGVPFVAHVRADLGAEAIAAVAGLGLVAGEALPGMALRPGSVPDPPAALSIRVATDEARLGEHRSAVALGFGLPLQLIERLMPPTLLANPNVRVYVGLEDGVPVATSMAFRTDEVLGIYNVATIESARGRGYGTAMTWAVVADAEPGVDLVILQASALGRPVYERMGFRTVVEYVELEEPTGERPDRTPTS
jgi:predicted GNAT family acetyltransferase